MVNSKKVTTNLLWRLLERFGAQLVTFIVSIILARLLDPVVYGTVALVTAITAILQVFVDSGLGTALIQKKDSDDLDFSTVFYFNIAMCIVIYLLIFFTAPLIAQFYDQEELSSIIRVLGVSVIISGIKNVQQAYVSKNFLFKRFFFATLGGTIVAAIVGLSFAYLGYGVWALVAQYLINLIIDTLILWITVKWRPKKVFSFWRLRVLFSYGWKLLASALLETGYRQLRSLIIGKKYSSEDLAFYNRGEQFPNIIVSNINASIDSVLLPTLSEAQDNRDRVKTITRRAIKTSTYIIMPMMIGLAVCAEPIIIVVLTKKWLPAVLYLRIFCVSHAFYPIHTANLNAIKAIGRSDIYLWLEILKKIIGIITIICTMLISVEAMAFSLLGLTFVSQLINSFPNKKLLGYSYLEQVKDMMPQILLSLFMGVIVYFISYISMPILIQLIVQILIGTVLYIGLSALFKLESFEYLLNSIKKYFNNIRKNKGDKND